MFSAGTGKRLGRCRLVGTGLARLRGGFRARGSIDTGATRANSKVADFLFYGICGGTGKPAFKDERARVTAAIFWMKTRGGWSETSTHKHTGVANGEPIEVDVVTVRERLTRRIARIVAARTTGEGPETDE